MSSDLVLELCDLTSEYIRVRVGALFGGVWQDVTVDTAQLAFIKGPAKPGNPDWQATSWETDATGTPTLYYARAIPSPALTKGEWNVWIKLTSTPEVVVRRVRGTVRVS